MTQRGSSAAELRHPLLEASGATHAFGTRSSVAPDGLCRPRQVHGVAVARPGADGAAEPLEADAIVCDRVGQAIAVVTADCVPILACSRDGAAVAAIHAGWKGLAAGVVQRGMGALRDAASSGAELRAVVGPCIGVCCYEVDGPVLDALEPRFGASLAAALRPSRPGHARLDLAALALEELLRCGVAYGDRASIPDACTRCDSERFHSYRRDGDLAGRLVHHIAPRDPARDGSA